MYTSVAFTIPESIGMQRDQPHWGVGAERAGKHQADEEVGNKKREPQKISK